MSLVSTGALEFKRIPVAGSIFGTQVHVVDKGYGSFFIAGCTGGTCVYHSYQQPLS